MFFGKRGNEENMKKFASLIMTMLLVLSVTACGKAEPGKTSDTAGSGEAQTQSSEAQEPESEYASGKHSVEIVVKDYGTIQVELDADVAPITVTNFLKLVNAGFYDGLTFHRIINGFMIQGGDPLGNGTGGSEERIQGEFSANGVENTLSHTRGAISMARSKDMNSARSQFFIVHEDSDYLDGQYACFGYVTEGIEVVDDICATTPVTDRNGTVKAENQPVIESIKVLEEAAEG